MMEKCKYCQAVNDFKDLPVTTGHIYDCFKCGKQQRIGIPIEPPKETRELPERSKGAKPRISRSSIHQA